MTKIDNLNGKNAQSDNASIGSVTGNKAPKGQCRKLAMPCLLEIS
jgi:hypothetical protein